MGLGGFGGLGGSGGVGTSTKHKMSEGYQYAVLVLVAASEEEAAKQKEKGLENEYTDSHK